MVPELELSGVTYRVYREGTLRADGEASRVSFRRDTTHLVAEDLAVTLRGAGPVPVRVTAPEGEGLVSARTFAVSGGVLAVRGDDVARTARARYEPTPAPDGRVVGDDPVTVTGPGHRLDGRRFTIDPRTGEIVMRGGVRFVSGPREAR